MRGGCSQNWNSEAPGKLWFYFFFYFYLLVLSFCLFLVAENADPVESVLFAN